MEFDYSQEGNLCVKMMKYIKEILKKFFDKLTGVAQQPWTESPFDTKSDSTQLTKIKSNILHTYVMKLMFLPKRGRPDILSGIGYLSTRISQSNEVDRNKLKTILNFLMRTKERKINSRVGRHTKHQLVYRCSIWRAR